MEREIDVIAKYWDDYSPEFDAAHDTEDIDLWREELSRLTERKTGLKVLDIGTGTGFLALMLAELGNDAWGIDVSDKMMELGRQHAKERQVNVTFQHSEGEHLPFADDTFDVVVNCRVLWTLVEPEVSLKEWKRVLKPGGKMLGFMRKHVKDWSYSVYEGGLDDRLPLKNATDDVYIHYLSRAEYTNPQVIDMPPELTVRKEGKDGEPMPPWVCVYGEKPL